MLTRNTYVLSRVHLFVIPWTVAFQALLSMEFSKPEYWSGLPFPPPGNPLDPGFEPIPSVSPTLAGRFFTSPSPGKLQNGGVLSHRQSSRSALIHLSVFHRWSVNYKFTSVYHLSMFENISEKCDQTLIWNSDIFFLKHFPPWCNLLNPN